MLIKRIISAIILIPIVVWAVLDLPWLGFALITAATLLLAAWEWAGLMPFENKKILKLSFIVSLLALFFIVCMLPQLLVLVIGLAWWLKAAVLVIIYPKASQRWGEGLIARWLMGLSVFVPCWLGFQVIHIQPEGAILLLYIVVVVWCADTFAYFVGKKWGKHKLIPQVSPGKTVAGLLGGILTSAIIAAVGTLLLTHLNIVHHYFYFFFLTVVCILFSIVGDLFESAMKRQSGVKDSGQLLPGHGGMLDRIDSLLAAIPIFALGLLINLYL